MKTNEIDVTQMGEQIKDSLALIDFGACRDGDPVEWMFYASNMCKHCVGSEDVNFAAARIIAAEYRNILKILGDPVAVHLNLLRGTIAYTREGLKHVMGDTQLSSDTINKNTL